MAIIILCGIASFFIWVWPKMQREKAKDEYIALLRAENKKLKDRQK